MHPSEQASALDNLVTTLSAAGDLGDVFTLGLPAVSHLAGAQAALLLREHMEGLATVAATGLAVDVPEGMSGLPAITGALTDLPVPEAWAAAGVTRAGARRMPSLTGVLVLLWTDDAVAGPLLEPAVAALDMAVGRVAAEERYADLAGRVDHAQQLANMGDYDWHIASDTNQWSDQLYRIYGHEPQSFDASYDRFLSLIHPDDRNRVAAVHQQAYATGEPFQMIERVVRPDGEVRVLSSNGEVIMDQDGRPMRMRGTCIDITDRVRAEEQREKHAARFQAAQLRRKQALEINDNVVQGLIAAVYALEGGDADGAQSYLGRTLAAARMMMDDLLEPLEGEGLQPGDLVRARPATLRPEASSPVQLEPLADPPVSPHRVLIVDDSDDLRDVFRMRLERQPGYEVVGEAVDGLEAVEMAATLRPDVVLLDIAMPRMDGLEALPKIREVAEGVRIVVLSGFNQSTMAEKALAAGADRYLVKGSSMRELVGILDGLFAKV